MKSCAFLAIYVLSFAHAEDYFLTTNTNISYDTALNDDPERKGMVNYLFGSLIRHIVVSSYAEAFACTTTG